MRKILLIGFSQINQTIASWFEKKRVGQVTYCNRTVHKLQVLQLPFLLWEQRERWTEYDLIILGTKAPEYVIDSVPCSINQSKLLIDLSIPRNVAPQVSSESNITLLNIDQLCCLTQRHFIRMAGEYVDNSDIFQAVKRQMSIFELKQLAKLQVHIRST